tara:strand:+ start:2755 stop:4824 length:2070 start_codon:yes stop_codon:yes gene_type:complete
MVSYSLEELKDPLENLQETDIPSIEHWNDLILELENDWNIDEMEDDDDYIKKAALLSKNFFNISNDIALSSDQIAEYFEPRKWQVTNLIMLRFKIKDAEDTLGEDKDRLLNILKRIYHGRDILKSFISFKNTFEEGNNNDESYMKLAYWLEFDESTCKNAYQKVLFRIQKSFEGKNWRRCGDCLLKPIHIRVYENDEDTVGVLIQTKAYEEACTIRDYVEDMCSADTDPDLWLLANENASIKKSVSENLEVSRIACLPDTRENHHIRSFGGDSRGRNAGIYNHEYDMFFRYGEEDLWSEQARKIQEIRRIRDPTYICKEPTRKDICIHHFNCPFYPRVLGITENLINNENCIDIQYIQSIPCDWYSIDPMQIQTPEWDRILESQGITDERSKFWVFALLGGRNLYRVREKDKLESAFYLWGEGGTGKSTTLAYVTGFYPFHRRGLMSNNMQTNFGMGALAEADIVECPEVQEVFNLAEEEFKSATSGEAMSLNDKHKKPIKIPHWLAHIILAGNHTPKNFNDDGGQFLRRVFGICFFNRINDMDTTLEESMEEKRSLYLRKFTLCYNLLLKQLNGKVPKKDSSLPPAFWQFTKTVKSQVNALVAFMQDSDVLEFGPNYAITLSGFKDAFINYAKEYGIDKTQHPKWMAFHSYSNILRANNCFHAGQATSPDNDIDVATNIICGCRLKII